MKFVQKLLRRSPPIPQHRQGVPSSAYWLADKLEMQRLKINHVFDMMDNVNERMRIMQRAWDDLVADVAALRDLPASIRAGFDAFNAKFAAEIEDLKAKLAASGGVSVADVEALDANVKQAVAEIREAIPQNT